MLYLFYLTESDNNYALILMPFLFKKITKLTKKSNAGKAWNPEKSEVLSTFVFHVQVNIYVVLEFNFI